MPIKDAEENADMESGRTRKGCCWSIWLKMLWAYLAR